MPVSDQSASLSVTVASLYWDVFDVGQTPRGKLLGHSSTRAAMIYQHPSCDRDDAITSALDALIVEARKHAVE